VYRLRTVLVGIEYRRIKAGGDMDQVNSGGEIEAQGQGEVMTGR
jgi:hypothetical protein